LQSRHRIENYRKDSDGHWEVDVLGRIDYLAFDCLPTPLTLSLERLYEGVALEPRVEEEDEDYELVGSY
jgi:hypothetical protein